MPNPEEEISIFANCAEVAFSLTEALGFMGRNAGASPTIKTRPAIFTI